MTSWQPITHCERSKQKDNFRFQACKREKGLLFDSFRRFAEMENFGRLDGLREENNGHLVSP